MAPEPSNDLVRGEKREANEKEGGGEGDPQSKKGEKNKGGRPPKKPKRQIGIPVPPPEPVQGMVPQETLWEAVMVD